MPKIGIAKVEDKHKASYNSWVHTLEESSAKGTQNII